MPTLVERTARKLADLSLAGEGDRFLGSEDELLARFGISRPTLRQAAKMVANDRLISVRRGSGGGFYATRPDAADSVRSLARYLRLKGASLSDIMVVTRPVSEQAAVLAAGCEDPELRTQLASFAARIDANDSPGAIVRAETELARILAAMSGNAAIELVMAIGFSFGLEEQGGKLYADPQERARARELQRGLVDAVLARDGEVARLMMQRRSAQIGAWLAR
jgi:GntR family transcriptional regulator, transcriptional repressor for pyruvate dehydrogenase complex